jgi:mannan polymerase II complex MNN10 subunit
MWHKLEMIERAIASEKYDWIWWIDFDTLITNMAIRLEDIILEALGSRTDPHAVNLLLTADW